MHQHPPLAHTIHETHACMQSTSKIPQTKICIRAHARAHKQTNTHTHTHKHTHIHTPRTCCGNPGSTSSAASRTTACAGTRAARSSTRTAHTRPRAAPAPARPPVTTTDVAPPARRRRRAHIVSEVIIHEELGRLQRKRGLLRAHGSAEIDSGSVCNARPARHDRINQRT